jgi:hypothetical protein
MELKTKIDISRKQLRLDHNDRIMLLGSCFADNIGAKLAEGHFDCNINPFGTLYNPLSVAEALRQIMKGRTYSADDREVFCFNGIWHSWMHHSRFSAGDAAELTGKVNEAIAAARNDLQRCSLLVVTLGSAYVYRLKEDGRVVANCHKMNESIFERSRLEVDEIVDEWTALIDEMRMANPQIRVMFTVSPIRHKRDGLHANQLSKATLLLAADRLCQLRPEACIYFPSYEIMMDELRDYRFYADDMVHPTPLAVEYIWERFCDAFFDRRTMEKVAECRKIEAAKRHRTII